MKITTTIGDTTITPTTENTVSITFDRYIDTTTTSNSPRRMSSPPPPRYSPSHSSSRSQRPLSPTLQPFTGPSNRLARACSAHGVVASSICPRQGGLTNPRHTNKALGEVRAMLNKDEQYCVSPHCNLRANHRLLYYFGKGFGTVLEYGVNIAGDVQGEVLPLVCEISDVMGLIKKAVDKSKRNSQELEKFLGVLDMAMRTLYRPLVQRIKIQRVNKDPVLHCLGLLYGLCKEVLHAAEKVQKENIFLWKVNALMGRHQFNISDWYNRLYDIHTNVSCLCAVQHPLPRKEYARTVRIESNI